MKIRIALVAIAVWVTLAGRALPQDLIPYDDPNQSFIELVPHFVALDPTTIVSVEEHVDVKGARGLLYRVHLEPFVELNDTIESMVSPTATLVFAGTVIHSGIPISGVSGDILLVGPLSQDEIDKALRDWPQEKMTFSQAASFRITLAKESFRDIRKVEYDGDWALYVKLNDMLANELATAIRENIDGQIMISIFGTALNRPLPIRDQPDIMNGEIVIPSEEATIDRVIADYSQMD